MKINKYWNSRVTATFIRRIKKCKQTKMREYGLNRISITFGNKSRNIKYSLNYHVEEKQKNTTNFYKKNKKCIIFLYIFGEN